MAGHELLNFMDAYSGYNQIRMHPPDEDKIAYTGLLHSNGTPWGTSWKMEARPRRLLRSSQWQVKTPITAWAGPQPTGSSTPWQHPSGNFLKDGSSPKPAAQVQPMTGENPMTVW